MGAARLELEPRWVSRAAWRPRQRPPGPRPSISVSVHRLTSRGPRRWGGCSRSLHATRSCPPPPSLQWGPHSPGGGASPEPDQRVQQRSRSSLLRRMPVRGEYTIAPKLQREGGAEPRLGLQGPVAHTWPGGLLPSLPGAPHVSGGPPACRSCHFLPGTAPKTRPCAPIRASSG